MSKAIRAVNGAKHRGQKWLSLPVCALLLLGISACSRPTGDFGRAKPDFVHDKVMGGIGDLAARWRNDPVSNFNFTDDETLMRDLGWGLVRPPWVQDWIGGTIVELARTRIIPEAQGRVPVDLYYIFLRSDKFSSSNVRYDRVAVDAEGDSKLIMPFCKVALRVMRADEERIRALNAQSVATMENYKGANARVGENQSMIKWVKQAVSYRITAYKKALENLEIETPTQTHLHPARRAVRHLEQEARVLEQNCGFVARLSKANASLQGGEEWGDAVLDKNARRSRIYTGWGTARPAPRK